MKHLSHNGVMIPAAYVTKGLHISIKGTAMKLDSEQEEMIVAWENWVEHVDPAFIIGHNIFWFDLPYLSFRCNELLGRDLVIGKDDRGKETK